MPDDRMVHRAAGRSRKVSSLTDFEFRVWVQYELSADDFGVMLRSAAKLQSDNAYLEKKPKKAIERALARLVEIGLVDVFEHQGDAFIFQRDWQDWQKVKHARNTVLPCPSTDALERCTEKTLALFLEQHNGKSAAEVPQSSGNVPAEVSPLARAGARETANGKRLEANGSWLPARRGARGGPLMAGGSYLTHQKHGACNDRGLCVPQFLHDEFIGKANGDAVHVADFYAAELAALPLDAVPGDDPIAFWRNAWRRRHGSTQQKAGLVDKLKASDDAAKAILTARGHR